MADSGADSELSSQPASVLGAVAAVITALAALVGAVVGLIALFGGDDSDATDPPPTRSVVTPTTSSTSTTTILTTSTTSSSSTSSPPTASTAAVVPSVESTGVPTTTAAPYVFPFPDYFTVPELGIEPVRGSGCGSGPEYQFTEVRDGIWNGFVDRVDTDNGDLYIDIACVYHGESADPEIAEGSGTGDRDFYQVNNRERLRSVPLGPNFAVRDAVWQGQNCADPGPSNESTSGRYLTEHSWLTVEGGAAVLALVVCAVGG